MNYETGMAGITLIPSLKEFNVYIRSLQEIEIPTTVARYLTYVKNYYKFLNRLRKIELKDTLYLMSCLQSNS